MPQRHAGDDGVHGRAIAPITCCRSIGCIWVNDGDRFSVGDRELVAGTPPAFDSPTTRGLFDPSTGVYWAVDSFGCPVTHDVRNVNELDEGFWREGFLQFQRMVSPWHQWLDPTRFAAHIDSVRRLGATKIANAHGPTLHGAQLEVAYDLMAQIPNMEEAPLPTQADLDGMLAAFAPRTCRGVGARTCGSSVFVTFNGGGGDSSSPSSPPGWPSR